jgi:hypothetical protein
MVPLILKLFANFKVYRINMLGNLSLPGCSYQLGTAMRFRKFKNNDDYSVNKSIEKYKLTEKPWHSMVVRYIEQDKEAERDTSKNVSEEDYEYFKDFFKSCHMCNEGFSFTNKPTLDRIDNDEPHTKENVKPCCLYCNVCKARCIDEDMIKLKIQLRKYAQLNNYSMLLGQGQEALCYIIRNGITGGLSNVHNRFNIPGISTIKSPLYNHEDDTVSIVEGGLITHNICLDANSLYPSSFSSIYLSWNRYTDHTLYMAGELQRTITDKVLAMKIINGREELFICVLKGEIPKKYYNTPIPGASSIFANVLKFPPIIRNIDIKTSPEVIGQTMYNYMKENRIPRDKKERKLA